MDKEKGYLVFTTHDGDEVDATFVPATETKLIHILENSTSEDEQTDAFCAWSTDEKNKVETWRSQVGCQEPWPFNNKEILGTFYCLIY